jgi:hypothetical protein
LQILMNPYAPPVAQQIAAQILSRRAQSQLPGDYHEIYDPETGHTRSAMVNPITGHVTWLDQPPSGSQAAPAPAGGKAPEAPAEVASDPTLQKNWDAGMNRPAFTPQDLVGPRPANETIPDYNKRVAEAVAAERARAEAQVKDDPSFTNYTSGVSAFNALLKNAADNGSGAEFAMRKNLDKIFNPTGRAVSFEDEMRAALEGANLGPDKLNAIINEIRGTGQWSEETRRLFVKAAQNQVGEYRRAYTGGLIDVGSRVHALGISPRLVLPSAESMDGYDEKTPIGGFKIGKPKIKPTSEGEPPPPKKIRKYNPDTGNLE